MDEVFEEYNNDQCLCDMVYDSFYDYMNMRWLYFQDQIKTKYLKVGFDSENINAEWIDE